MIDLNEMKVEELRILRDAIEAKLKDCESQNVVQRYTASFGCYNERRYSKPWIAKIVAWSIGSPPDLVFGGFLGNENDGGEVEIIASSGDIIRWGQRDNRNFKKTENHWGIAQKDGSILACSMAEARIAFKS